MRNFHSPKVSPNHMNNIFSIVIIIRKQFSNFLLHFLNDLVHITIGTFKEGGLTITRDISNPIFLICINFAPPSVRSIVSNAICFPGEALFRLKTTYRSFP